MGLFSEFEHSAEKKLSSIEHSTLNTLSVVEHSVENSARVAETLAEGAWDYTKTHPKEVAKTAAIAVGTGALVGAAMALLPEVAIVGAVVGVGGAVLGAVGLTSMGVQTYDAFKKSMPNLKIVYHADEHSTAQVNQAKQNLEKDTGAVVTNAVLLVPSFVLGNIAGNLGADAGLAGKAAMLSSTGAGESGVATAALATETAVNAGTATAASDVVASDAAASNAPGVWQFINHNPLEDIQNPNLWMRLNNNNVFSFESNYWLEKADIAVMHHLPKRISSILAPTSL